MSNTGSSSSNGVVALVLGILSFVGFGCLTGIPAWIIGSKTLKEISVGRQPSDQRGMAQAGMILGIISTVLTILGIMLFFTTILAIFGIAAGVSAGS